MTTRSATGTSDDTAAHKLRGTVLDALDLPDGAEFRARVDLAAALTAEIRRRGLSQKRAAGILGIHQPDVSNLMGGKVEGFSQERLQRLLNRLGLHVHVQVGMRSGRGRAGVSVEDVGSF